MKVRLVVIGNGMAGMKAVEEVLYAHNGKYEIVVFGAEPYGNYNRIMLSPVLCGEKNIDEIMINDLNWYQKNGITLHAGPAKEVVSINRAKRLVIAKDGTTESYDKLLLATGSNPFILPVPGHDLEGVMAFREIYDVEKMVSASKSSKNAIVLGGGLLGLEAANGLRARGMDVTVIHNTDAILNRQLDRQASKLLQAELEGRGIKFKLSAKTSALLGNNDNHISSVEFENGDVLDCDLFVMAIGVRPNIKLAQEAGLYCERGIVVNDTLQTYDPSVYAVGECIQHRGDTFGLVAPLFDQAKVCANHLTEHGMASYKTLPMASKLKITGINVFSVGDFVDSDSKDCIRFFDRKRAIYKKLVIENNILVGAVLYGETLEGGWYQELIENQIDVSSMRHILMFGQAYANKNEAPSSELMLNSSESSDSFNQPGQEVA